jgi:hypothetical protein
VLQVTVDAVTRWLYPDLDRELQLIDLGLDPEGLHSGFLQSWISLITEAQNMMPFDQVGTGLVGNWPHGAMSCVTT